LNFSAPYIIVTNDVYNTRVPSISLLSLWQKTRLCYRRSLLLWVV